MKDLFKKKDIIELIKSEPLDIVDGDQVYFNISTDLEIELCVCYDTKADQDHDGFKDSSTYEMKIKAVYLEKNNTCILLDFTKSQLKNLEFSGETEETIKENYLID